MVRQPYSVAVSSTGGRLHPLPFWKGRGLGCGLRTLPQGEGQVGHMKCFILSAELAKPELSIRQVLNPTKDSMSIQARTFLRRSARQVTMPHNLCLRKELMQIDEQISDSLLLLLGERIGRLAILIQTSLIADADTASIIRNAMCTHFQQHSVLRLLPILSDIEVIANATEAASQMVTEQHFLRIVSVTSRSRAVNNEVFHLLFRHHLKSSHDNDTL